MSSTTRPIALSLALAGIFTAAAGATTVVPNVAVAADGTTDFSGPLGRFARSFQLLVDDTQLTAEVGKYITGVTWRLPGGTGAGWPASNVTYADFDIYLSGSVEPSARSLTLASNVAGSQTQVRNGGLIIPAGSFAQTNPGPAPFGFVITFDTPYLYSGGNLLLEMRQSAHDGTDRTVDAFSTSSAGYGTGFSALWGSGATATTGIAANAIATQFITTVPEPASMTALIATGAVVGRRRRAMPCVTP